MSKCDYIICDAPWPPSINELKSLVKIGKGYQIGKSSVYKRYQKNVFNPWWMSVRQKGALDFGDRIIAWYILCPPRVNCDVDKFTKCFHDSLQLVKGITHDKYVLVLRTEQA